MRRAPAVLLGAAWIAVTTAPARAAPITVGMFAPSAPFASTAARVELMNQLAARIGEALHRPAAGRVYARAADFTAALKAIKKADATLAVVDPVYLAGSTGYTLIATARIGDDQPAHPWRLVVRTGTTLGALHGKRVLVPSVGGRETELVLTVLLGGDVGRDFFAKIEAAPDTASALVALGLGKADAVVVPAAGELPAGTVEALALPALSNPLLVVYGPMTAEDRDAVLAAATAFPGDATLSGFRAADPDAVQRLARRFAPPAKLGPFAVPAARPAVGELVQDRRFAIERTPAAAFVVAPPAR